MANVLPCADLDGKVEAKLPSTQDFRTCPCTYTYVRARERGRNTRVKTESIKMKIQRGRDDDIARIIEKRRSRGIRFIYGRIDFALFFSLSRGRAFITGIYPSSGRIWYTVDTMHSRLMSNIVRYGTAARTLPREDGDLRVVTHTGEE